jgi:hypothetical protein
MGNPTIGMLADSVTPVIDALKWPATTVICLLIVLFLFRAQWAIFVSRITSIGKGGVKTGPPPGQQSESLRDKQTQDLLRAFDSVVILEQEQAIKADLEKRGLASAGESIEVLIRHLAQSQLVVRFEEVYRTIFGSQLTLLKRANETRLLLRSTAEEHFQQTQARFPQLSSWTFDSYMNFFFSRTLLTRIDGNYAITNPGVDFLSWMAKIGAFEQKPL